MGTELCQMLFFFFLAFIEKLTVFLLYSVNRGWQWLLYSCNKPKHTLVYYLSITGFDLMVFCSDFLCLCSWGISAIVFFSYKYLITFSCQDYALIKQAGKYSLILLLKRFYNTILFLLKMVIEFTTKKIWAWNFFLERFLIADEISFIDSYHSILCFYIIILGKNKDETWFIFISPI